MIRTPTGAEGTVPRSIQLFLIDESTLTHAGLVAIISHHDDIEIAGHATTELSALESFKNIPADVILINAISRAINIANVIRHISHRHEAGAACVLLLASETGDLSFAEAERLGVGGIVRAGEDAQMFLAAIRIVARGYSVVASSGPGIRPECASQRPAQHPPAPAALPPPQRRSALDSLTQREQEVLRWLAKGLKNSEIAAELVLSESTVKSHVQNVLTKLGLRNRASAVAVYYELSNAATSG